MRRIPLLIGSLLILSACTTTRGKFYEDTLEPMVGVSKFHDVNKQLGSPTTCVPDVGLTRCEYRTAVARNLPVPAFARRVPGMGPDLSPYEYFDVLYVYYDDTGLLKEWTPMVVLP